jgi:D-alanine-D-alanine ligase
VTTPAGRTRVALVFGGRSGEHEVSLRSAASVMRALRDRHDVLPVLIDKSGSWFLQDGAAPEPRGGTPVFLVPEPDDAGRLRRRADGAVLAEPQVYFPLLHGTYGEDGTIQGLFEMAGVAYVGAGVAASAAGMDKELMRSLFAAAGIPQGPYAVLRGRDPKAEDAALRGLGLPVFVKPANLGSSVAVAKVKRRQDLGAALDAALAYDLKVLVEAAIDAREIEVSVLGNERPLASRPGEIVPDREFYDYDSKYSEASRTQLVSPACLDPALEAELRDWSVRAYRAVDACGYARVDFFVERGSSRVLVNEINTIPGFTSISMFPRLWEVSGLGYADLVARLVELGLARHARRAALRTDYR